MIGAPRLLLVAGAPASGKSTLAARLAAELRLPLLSKDLVKEALFDGLGTPDREGSRRYSVAAYRVLYAVAAPLLAAGNGVILESNFVRGRSEAELLPLTARADAALLHCRATAAEIERRYRQRAWSGGRHPGHRDAEALPDVLRDVQAGRYEPLALDIPALLVDTSAGYRPDLAAILAFARGERAR